MSDTQKITVRLTPNAKQNKILGWDNSSTDLRILKIQVTAIPEKGKANSALIKLLSKEWSIPKSAIKIIRGETSRTKTLEIEAEKDLLKLSKQAKTNHDKQ